MPSTLRCGCKINLFLRLLDKRPDGYHELSTLFLPLPEPYDELEIFRDEHDGGKNDGDGKDTPRLTLLCSAPDISPDKNTLTKAHRLYAEATGFAPRLTVRLNKGIPQGAGLGGGSADAACLLDWLQARSPAPLSEEKLVSLAAKVGADVPFFLHSVPCLAEGIGEKMTELEEELPPFHIVLICPEVRISTAWAFSLWDASRKNLTGAKSTDKNHPLSFPLFSQLQNDFEEVIFPEFPILAGIKEKLLQQGAFAALLSGSGSSLFGLFRVWENAQAAKKFFEAEQDCRAYGPFNIKKGATPKTRS